MFNLGSLPTLVLVYPLWGLATPLVLAGIGGGLLGTILASVGLLRGRAPWYSALKYLLILLASFAIWQTGADLVSPWSEGQGPSWLSTSCLRCQPPAWSSTGHAGGSRSCGAAPTASRPGRRCLDRRSAVALAMAATGGHLRGVYAGSAADQARPTSARSAARTAAG